MSVDFMSPAGVYIFLVLSLFPALAFHNFWSPHMPPGHFLIILMPFLLSVVCMLTTLASSHHLSTTVLYHPSGFYLSCWFVLMCISCAQWLITSSTFTILRLTRALRMRGPNLHPPRPQVRPIAGWPALHNYSRLAGEAQRKSNHIETHGS